MTTEVTLREPLGDRLLSATDFPVSIGGEGSDINVRSPGSGVLAWLGQHEGKIFIQPAESGTAILHNGSRIDASAWLRNGDVLDIGGGRLSFGLENGRAVLSVIDGALDNLTVPPAAEASVSVSGTGPDDDEPLEAIAFRSQRDVQPAEADTPAWRRPIVFGGMGLLAALAFYIFTSVPVQVDIEPKPDTIRFEDGWPGLHFGGGHLLRPGKYRLLAEKPGYEVLNEAVEITRVGDQRFRFNLNELPGTLSIELPVPGKVSIDGKPDADAPGEFELMSGKHRVKIRTDRYLEYTADVTITGKGERQSLQPELTPGWARVSISSEPEGAQVLVGGESRGTTPLELDLMAGSHALELRRDGFRPWVADIETKANEPLSIGPVRLGVPDGRLTVRSKPAGASVTIGGAYKGRTPLQVELRPDVTMAVEISRDGYEPAQRSVTLGSGEEKTLDAVLHPILGEVIVKAQPADATLFIDGVASGRADQALQLVATDHTIEVRSPGFAPYRTTVTPRPGLTQRIEVTLLKGSAPSAAPASERDSAQNGSETAAAVAAVPALATTIRSGAGQELRLLPTGAYTMGSPRREAGRRANEGMHPVELRRRVYLATREVTNAEFRQFRPGHRSGYVGQSTLDLDRQPVVSVSWQDAAAYCNWLSSKDGLDPAYLNQGGRLVPADPMTNGYRLPTEAEWEWAARYSGGRLTKYPWGGNLPVPAGSGNYADRQAQPLVSQFLSDLDDGYAVTAPVGSFPANSLGFFDMGGNVAEWAHDLYTVRTPGGKAVVDPIDSEAGAVHGIRGSSWKHAAVTELRLSFRDFGDGKRNDVGFRIARYAQ